MRGAGWLGVLAGFVVSVAPVACSGGADVATGDPDETPAESCQFDGTTGSSNPFGMGSYLSFVDGEIGSTTVWEGSGNALGDWAWHQEIDNAVPARHAFDAFLDDSEAMPSLIGLEADQEVLARIRRSFQCGPLSIPPPGNDRSEPTERSMNCFSFGLVTFEAGTLEIAAWDEPARNSSGTVAHVEIRAVSVPNQKRRSVQRVFDDRTSTEVITSMQTDPDLWAESLAVLGRVPSDLEPKNWLLPTEC